MVDGSSGSADPLVAERAAATAAIVDSTHPRRVIVAGPGTGKSYTFKLALRQRGSGGLALTFLRRLAGDLRQSLSAEAEAYTFHGFAKRQMKAHIPAGLRPGFALYPALMKVALWDLGLLGVHKSPEGLGPRLFKDRQLEMESTVQALDFGSPVPDWLLRLGTFYNAAGFPDLVLRMYLHQRDHPEDILSYPLVVVDEYQDFSPLETAIIDQLASRSDVLIAGDDDQALYAFRKATPEAFRALAADGASLRFPLPFCSRCTSVVVDAVQATISRATAIGLLAGRLDKDFRDFPPDKRADSEAHPTIYDVRCTSEPYMKRYIAAKIAAIPVEDIREASREGYPTVLVIGPNPFLGHVADFLRQLYPDPSADGPNEFEIARIDGYKYLARDPRSNLGWRILMQSLRPEGWGETIRHCLSQDEALVDSLEPEFVREHLAILDLFVRGLAGELDEEQRSQLAGYLGVDADRLDETLGRAQDLEPPEEGGEGETVLTLGAGESADEAGTVEVPSIVFTSLMGSKGLSAAYVFVVGCSNGHFPRDPVPTDVEVCQFLVALSRTRKECHLLSCRYLGEKLEPSTFLSWISGQTTRVWIDKDSVPLLPALADGSD